MLLPTYKAAEPEFGWDNRGLIVEMLDLCTRRKSGAKIAKMSVVVR